jgi:hypothetical protein
MQNELFVAEVKTTARDIRAIAAAIEKLTVGSEAAALAKMARRLADKILDDAGEMQ